jgi:hypothetical protein
LILVLLGLQNTNAKFITLIILPDFSVWTLA